MSRATIAGQLHQELKVSPHLLQSIEILQMNSQELLEYLNHIRDENPVIEMEESHALQKEYEQLRQQANWINGGVAGSTVLFANDDFPEHGAIDSGMESLSAFLCDQLERKRLSKPHLALCRYMAQMVDDDGRLLQEDLDSLLSLNIPQKQIDAALDTLQSLEPAGVGARNLSECLLLQLRRKSGLPVGVIPITAHFLSELSRGHYRAIARALNLTVEEVRTAEKYISTLDPYPGRAFQTEFHIAYVRPDLFIAEIDGSLCVIMNEYYLPRITISDYYTRLIKDSDDTQARQYLQQKIQQAKCLLHNLERRSSMLRTCGDEILALQHDFFSGVSQHLLPMSLATLAQRLSVHPSTVTRALKGKHLQCQQGTYPLRYFFSRSVGTSDTSQQAIKLELLQLIKREDPACPFSDQKLCQLLEENGMQIARRTVTKYRNQLGILPAPSRKK